MTKNNIIFHFVNNQKIKFLKIQIANIFCRHKLKKIERIHVETMCEKTIEKKRDAYEMCRILNFEIQKFQKVCVESIVVRKTFENRIKKYFQIKNYLKREFVLKRHSHRCTKINIIYFRKVLQFMNRFSQIQFQLKIENLSSFVIEKTLFRNDMKRMKLKKFEKKIANVKNFLIVSNTKHETTINTNQIWWWIHRVFKSIIHYYMIFKIISFIQIMLLINIKFVFYFRQQRSCQ